jgi:uncharacterized protein YdcH (DUF465 family)
MAEADQPRVNNDTQPTGPDLRKFASRLGVAVHQGEPFMENHTQDEELKAHLRASDEQFRSLCEQHARLKQQIEAIEAKPHVTEADEIEEQRLKKLKLHTKDQMNEILSNHRQAASV